MVETLPLISSGKSGSKNSAPHFWHFKSVERAVFIVVQAKLSNGGVQVARAVARNLRPDKAS